MALAASIAVDQDNKDRFQEGQNYTYEDVTGVYKNSAKGMLARVEYDLIDEDDPSNAGKADEDKNRLLARATVDGIYVSAFAGIFPKYSVIEYSVSSDVAYSLKGGKPATVFFAVDNSGSMGWLDESGANKLNSLESSMRNFMEVLDGVNTGQNDIFRTALYPYSADYYGWYNTIDDDGVIPNRVVSPDWGTLTTGEINSMSTLSGTDSSGALEDAQEALQDEDAKHLAKNGTADPLKYMIFMSDGSNNSSTECKTEEVWVDGDSEYWVYYSRERNWERKRRGSVYYDYYDWMRYGYYDYYPGTEGGFEDKEVCTTDYHADTQSIASCNSMKDDGVTVYSIGYSLIAGLNGVSQSEVDRAKDLLESCASSADHYVLASNASQLNEVFKQIGEEIVEEVVRVKR